MAEEMVEVMNFLEVEPAAALPAPGPDIPALRENLAILVSSGRCKESIGKELSILTGCLALRCGRLLALANSVLISAKHVDFSAEEPRHPSRDLDGYPLAGQDEVDVAKQYLANAQQLLNITRQFLN